MKQTALERLIHNLPPDRQAAAMDALLLLSQHPDGPIFTLYAEMFERIERHEKEVTTVVTLHASSTKETLNREITKHFADQKQSAKGIENAIRTGHVPGPLRRTRALLRHPLFSGFVVLAVIFGHRELKPKSSAPSDQAAAQPIVAEQIQKLTEANKTLNSELITEKENFTKELAAARMRQTASEIIGDAILNQGMVPKISNSTMTLTIPKAFAKTSGQSWLVEVQHKMSPDQVEILKGAIQDTSNIPTE